MKCFEAKKHIVAFLDGELRHQDERAMYQHLASCSSCSEYMGSMDQIDGMLKDALTFVAAPPDFTQKLMLRLDSELTAEKDCCVVGAGESQHTDLSQEREDHLERDGDREREGDRERRRKWWLPSLSNGWLKSGIAASMAVVLLFGGLGLTGNAYMDEPLPKRMVLISRDGISGIRRVVDNVIQLAQSDKVEDKTPAVKKPDTEKPGGAGADVSGEDGSNATIVEEFLAVEDPGTRLGDLDIALQQDELGKLRVSEGEKSAADEDTVPDSGETAVPKVSMTAVVSPVIVIHGIDNIRPVWVDNDTVFYLSEREAPGEGSYTIWETDARGTTRRMVSAPGYAVSLAQGGGVWSSYFQNYAFVTNTNGYWQLAYSSLKGEYTKAVQDDSTAATPAPGMLWEYNPVPSANGELAFLTKRFGSVDLMAVDHQGDFRVLTKTPGVTESNPAWSPDGARIAYVSTSSGSSRVMVADKNGNNPVAVTPAMSNVNMIPAWADKGNEIAVNVGNAGSRNGLWLVNSDGSNWRQITDKGGGNIVAWSPNGGLIAFTDAKSRLYVWDVTRGADDPEAIIRVAPTDQDGKVNYVCWSPDSKRLLLEWDGAQTKTSAIWRAEIISFK